MKALVSVECSGRRGDAATMRPVPLVLVPAALAELVRHCSNVAPQDGVAIIIRLHPTQRTP